MPLKKENDYYEVHPQPVISLFQAGSGERGERNSDFLLPFSIQGQHISLEKHRTERAMRKKKASTSTTGKMGQMKKPSRASGKLQQGKPFLGSEDNPASDQKKPFF